MWYNIFYKKILREAFTLENDKLIISHFSKRYGSSKVFAVEDVNIEVNAGEVFGFIGHNGAGKSTTIKSLVGIQPITKGDITVFGHSIAKDPLKVKQLIGYVSDNHATYEKLTGRKYVQTIANLYGVPKEEFNDRLLALTDDFNLTPAIDNKIKNYSHGMKQKLAIIASLIHEPKVWVLDEPLTGLDPMSAITLKDKMREHANKGNVVFFSSHIIEVVEKICDKIAIINHGHIECSYYIKDLNEQGISLQDLYMKYFDKGDSTNIGEEDKK